MRSRAMFPRLVQALILSAFGTGLLSCSPSFTDNQALTQLRFNGIGVVSGGAFRDSIGVVSEIFNHIGDDVTLQISNEVVSPGVPPDAIYDVILEGYNVSFERSDAGTAVPASFGSVYTTRILATGFNQRDQTPVTIRILQPEQKSLPPLDDLGNFGLERSTGFVEIQTIATVNLFGHNRIGDRADLTLRLRVTFCNSCKVQ